MSDTKKTDKKTDATEDAKPEFALVDYQGTIAGARHVKALPHTHSPFVVQLREQGVPELVLYPGLNRIPAALFERYVNEEQTIGSWFAQGLIKQLPAVPTGHDLVSLIERSIYEPALKWLSTQLGFTPQNDADGAYAEAPSGAARGNEVARATLTKRLRIAAAAPKLTAERYTAPGRPNA